MQNKQKVSVLSTVLIAILLLSSVSVFAGTVTKNLDCSMGSGHYDGCNPASIGDTTFTSDETSFAAPEYETITPTLTVDPLPNVISSVIETKRSPLCIDEMTGQITPITFKINTDLRVFLECEELRGQSLFHHLISAGNGWTKYCGMLKSVEIQTLTGMTYPGAGTYTSTPQVSGDLLSVKYYCNDPNGGNDVFKLRYMLGTGSYDLKCKHITSSETTVVNLGVISSFWDAKIISVPVTCTP